MSEKPWKRKMTVQELLDRLNKVEDKSKEVLMSCCYLCDYHELYDATELNFSHEIVYLEMK